MSNTVEVAQLKVQQKLGRCILRLQQYERLLKTMVATMSLEGNPEDLPGLRSRQDATARTKTLGALVGMFTGDYLIAARPETEATPVDFEASDQAAQQDWLPERHEQTVGALAELVAMRNSLVHHLIEQFDISEESGCLAATSHLQDCYQQIDDHLRRLMDWSAGHAKAQGLALSLLQSKEFENAFVHGINPDGTVCWPRSTIVECLRDAEGTCGVDGWTSLDTAIAFIMREHRDQTPTLYGCKTWRLVLKKSGQFELRTVSGSDGGRGQAWYRSWAESPGDDVSP